MFQPLQNRVHVDPGQVLAVLFHPRPLFAPLILAALLPGLNVRLITFHHGELFLLFCYYIVPEHFRGMSGRFGHQLSAHCRQPGLIGHFLLPEYLGIVEDAPAILVRTPRQVGEPNSFSNHLYNLATGI